MSDEPETPPLPDPTNPATAHDGPGEAAPAVDLDLLPDPSNLETRGGIPDGDKLLRRGEPD